MSTTLVLNADAQPVSVVPLSTTHWQDAIGKIWSDRVAVVEEYDLWVVRSPSVQMRMPAIVMCKEYQRHNGKVEFSRYNVVLRDNYTCQYCIQEFPFDALTFDHVIPRRSGGQTNWENIVSACSKCNQEKAHHSQMKPARAPRRPSYWDLATNRRKRSIIVPSDLWTQYLGWEGEIIVDKRLRVQNIEEEDYSLPFFGE